MTEQLSMHTKVGEYVFQFAFNIQEGSGWNILSEPECPRITLGNEDCGLAEWSKDASAPRWVLVGMVTFLPNSPQGEFEAQPDIAKTTHLACNPEPCS